MEVNKSISKRGSGAGQSADLEVNTSKRGWYRSDLPVIFLPPTGTCSGTGSVGKNGANSNQIEIFYQFINKMEIFYQFISK
jgi:hypothetical protein